MKNQESLASEAVPILFSLAVGRICAFGGVEEESAMFRFLLAEESEHEAIPAEEYSAEILDLSAGAWKPLPRMPLNFAAESCFAAVFSGTEGTP